MGLDVVVDPLSDYLFQEVSGALQKSRGTIALREGITRFWNDGYYRWYPALRVVAGWSEGLRVRNFEAGDWW
jgi:hypothetical protein